MASSAIPTTKTSSSLRRHSKPRSGKGIIASSHSRLLRLREDLAESRRNCGSRSGARWGVRCRCGRDRPGSLTLRTEASVGRSGPPCVDNRAVCCEHFANSLTAPSSQFHKPPSLRRAPFVGVGAPLGEESFHFTVDCRALRFAAFQITFKGRPESLVFRPPQLGYSLSQPRNRSGAMAV